uniref:Uncharacterized protein n=1 Tax=Setaria digitata TaxID=48799 RepID=A0A915PPP2_9BILA
MNHVSDCDEYYASESDHGSYELYVRRGKQTDMFENWRQHLAALKLLRESYALRDRSKSQR